MTRITGIISTRQESHVFVGERVELQKPKQNRPTPSHTSLSRGWLRTRCVVQSISKVASVAARRTTKARASGPALVHEACLFLGGSEATSAAQSRMPALRLVSFASRSHFLHPLLLPRHFLAQKKTEA